MLRVIPNNGPFQLPNDFLINIASVIYDLIAKFTFFVFEYEIVGERVSLVYDNPFSQEHVSMTVPNLGGGGIIISGIIDSIESIFDISLDLTFFNILAGPTIFFIFAFLVLKYFMPAI